MTIKEVYAKHYHQDLLDDFNYPESISGYEQALEYVVENSDKSVKDLVLAMDELRNKKMKDIVGDDQKWKFRCGWDYVRQNVPGAMRICKENIENPVFNTYFNSIPLFEKNPLYGVE